MNTHRIRLGVSACLLGERVRYDGGHKRDEFVAGILARHVELVPVCPEVAVGLGVPRPPIRLEGDAAAPRAVGVEDKTLDVTAPLAEAGRRTARELRDVSGFILKSRSPSCGVTRVKVVGASGRATLSGRGLFAQSLMKALPLLPVEEEHRLADPALRDHFLERVFAYRRWQALQEQGVTPARLVAFHASHKLILMAHSPGRCRELGQLISDAGTRGLGKRATAYGALFMQTLALRATRGKHANVLHHLLGYLKHGLDANDLGELLEEIDHYRAGDVPLIVPLTLLRHHFRRHPDAYVQQQIYLYPPPEERALRFA